MTATPRDNDAAANSRTGTGLRRFRKQQDRAGGPLYARARVERVRLDERYSYEQELSRNAFVTPTEPPRGRLQISVPYDGRDFLTRQACSDIEAGLAGEPGPDVREAQIGHLLLDNYDGTDLADVVNLIEPYGAMPILIPVGAAAGGQHVSLTSDEQTCVIRHYYAPSPDRPRVVPVHVEIDLLDPDSTDLPGLGEDRRSTSQAGQVARAITQQVSFRSHLLLRVGVHLDVPLYGSRHELRPRVARVSLGWPTITSLGALHLRIGHEVEDAAVTYDPVTRSTQWEDVPMLPLSDSGDGHIGRYISEEMLLFVEQPGELYAQRELEGQVVVEVPGLLLSGVEARLHDAAGRRMSNRGPRLLSTVTTQVRVVLDDAFARRVLSPFQHLHFDEVIPEDMRLADIVTALRDRGFEVSDSVRFRNDSGGATTRDLLHARRLEGPDTMELWVYIEGRQYTTERRNRVRGGHTYTSTFESGELKVSILGALPRDSRQLTHEMNALHQALRERFDRLRARR